METTEIKILIPGKLSTSVQESFLYWLASSIEGGLNNCEGDSTVADSLGIGDREITIESQNGHFTEFYADA